MREWWGRVRGGEREKQDKTKREMGRDTDPENTCLHHILWGCDSKQRVWEENNCKQHSQVRRLAI